MVSASTFVISGCDNARANGRYDRCPGSSAAFTFQQRDGPYVVTLRPEDSANNGLLPAGDTLPPDDRDHSPIEADAEQVTWRGSFANATLEKLYQASQRLRREEAVRFVAKWAMVGSPLRLVASATNIAAAKSFAPDLLCSIVLIAAMVVLCSGRWQAAQLGHVLRISCAIIQYIPVLVPFVFVYALAFQPDAPPHGLLSIGRLCICWHSSRVLPCTRRRRG